MDTESPETHASFEIEIEAHPLLRPTAFTTQFPEPLGNLSPPDWLLEPLAMDATVPIQRDEALRLAVRDMLRHWGHKPAGRGKPASEYLVQLAGLLREKAGLDVRLTREGDSAVGLIERTEAANREQADLFLSLHANAAVGGPASGAETYFLHLDATDESSRTVAALENDATGLGSHGSGGGLELLLWDMAQSQYLSESSRLAKVVQRELNSLAGTRDRGVKQANFLVLRGATMPAVLVEVGFLSNAAEERRMRSLGFQQATAEALYRAVIAFRDERRARGEE